MALFATVMVNPAGANGLFHGNSGLILVQLVAVASVALYSFVVTWILLRVTNAFCDLRVTHDEEESGLDITQHGEMGYSF